MNAISRPQAGSTAFPSTGDREALDNWVNEGGHPATSDAGTRPGGAALRDMAALFISDFANGRMGQHHNTYQHRARILRQLTATAAEGGKGESNDRP